MEYRITLKIEQLGLKPPGTYTRQTATILDFVLITGSEDVASSVMQDFSEVVAGLVVTGREVDSD